MNDSDGRRDAELVSLFDSIFAESDRRRAAGQDTDEDDGSFHDLFERLFPDRRSDP